MTPRRKKGILPKEHPYAFARPLRAVYDQESDSCVHCDSELCECKDWDWPVVPKQENRVPSTALMRMFNPDYEWAEYAQSIEYAQFVNDAEEGRL